MKVNKDSVKYYIDIELDYNEGNATASETVKLQSDLREELGSSLTSLLDGVCELIADELVGRKKVIEALEALGYELV